MAVLPETNVGAGIHRNSYLFYDDFTRPLPTANSMGAPQRDLYGIGWNANLHGNGNPPVFTAGGGTARFISQAPPSSLHDPCGFFPQYSAINSSVITPVYFRLTLIMSVIVADCGAFFSQYFDIGAQNFYGHLLVAPSSVSGNWLVTGASGPNPVVTLLDSGIVAANGDTVVIWRVPTGIEVSDPNAGLGVGTEYFTSQINMSINGVNVGSFLTNIPPAIDAVQDAPYGIGYAGGKQSTVARWSLFSVE